MKDATNHIINEALNPKNLIQVGSTIHLEYAWSIKDQQTDSAVLQIPNALKVKSDQQGNLMAGEQIIGQYFVKANDNKMKLVFNDQVKDSKGANGKISIDTVFNPDLKSGAKSVQLSFPLGATAKSISVPVQVDNPASPTTDKDTAPKPVEEQRTMMLKSLRKSKRTTMLKSLRKSKRTMMLKSLRKSKRTTMLKSLRKSKTITMLKSPRKSKRTTMLKSPRKSKRTTMLKSPRKSKRTTMLKSLWKSKKW